MSDRSAVSVTAKQLRELLFQFEQMAANVMADAEYRAAAQWYKQGLAALMKIREHMGDEKQRQLLWSDEVRDMCLTLLGYRDNTPGKHHKRLYKLVDRLLTLEPEFAYFDNIPPNLARP